MNISQIENKIQHVIKSFHQDTFIYDLLLAYGLPKATITRLQQGGLNLSKVNGEISWKKKLFFKSTESEDVHELIDDIKTDDKVIRHSPRFIVVTDYETLLAIDCKTSDTLDIPILDIAKHFDFFLPWAGMEKAQNQIENPADVKAAERMAKLYDEIKKDNATETPEEVHNLNVFLSRLLFCSFAEDTGIFEKNQFTNGITSHTQVDGSDLNTYLDKLFEVMNTEYGKRKNLPAYLDAFPYVNGGLLRNKHYAPLFTRRSRQAIIASGELDWRAINPDIFGSMIQAVITPEHRGGLGMHYTSVPNIKKVIEPLFLNALYEDFEAAKGNKKKLTDLLHRIWKIKIFDPACGSGNFLIIAYKELRRLEMKILKQLNSFALSNISLGNFYGIELDDFAHEIAILSLWLAEHQMNQEFFKEFGRSKPALPLKETGNIIHGNAINLDWKKVCPKKDEDEIYILGNPPYLGAKVQNKNQKSDLEHLVRPISLSKNMDYISCWFIKSSNYISNSICKVSFVSTSSIVQGEHVELLWPYIFSNNVIIEFCYSPFKWSNSAKHNAGVTVVIIGLSSNINCEKFIYTDNIKIKTENINAYLASGKNIFIRKESKSISNLPPIYFGSMPRDGGFLILSEEERNKAIQSDYRVLPFIKMIIGSKEFIRGEIRYCIWIEDNDNKAAYNIPFIKHRLDKVREWRLTSDAESTRNYAKFPHRFVQISYKNSNSIIIPCISSEHREYIPVGFLDKNTVINNKGFAIYDSDPWVFAVVTSRIHMNWVKVVAGRLETRINYSASLCYNAFPFPIITELQKKELQKHVYRVLEEREHHSEKTLAQLYDPDKMPKGLREAHHQLDLAVERCYRSKPFDNDEERLEYLFKLYEQMILEERTKGTLFEVETKSRKKKNG